MRPTLFKLILFSLIFSNLAYAGDCYKAEGDLRAAITGLKEPAKLIIKGTVGADDYIQYIVKGAKTKVQGDFSCVPEQPISCMLHEGPVNLVYGSDGSLTMIARRGHLALQHIDDSTNELDLAVMSAKTDQKLIFRVTDAKECKDLSDSGQIEFPRHGR